MNWEKFEVIVFHVVIMIATIIGILIIIGLFSM